MPYRFSRAAVVCACAVACALFVSTVPGDAFAAPDQYSTPEIASLQEQALEARAQMDDLAAQLELRAEEYAEIEYALDVTDQDIREIRAELAEAEAELFEAEKVLSSRVANIYRSGGTGAWELLLDTVSFRDLVSRLEFLARVGRSDAVAVESVRERRRQVDLARIDLENRRAEQVTLRDAAAAKRLEVERAVERQRSFIASIDSEIAALVEEERERQRILAEEAARRAEALASAAAAERVSDLSDLGGGRIEVVSIALEFVGVPYVWGGASPSGFDCSGLTQYVYSRIGIEIPRTSRAQYRSGVHVPSDRLDLLLPGDLVFFGYDGDPGQVHHVGIYVGNGDYLHAPQTGETIKIQSLTARIDQSGDYVGASRF